MENNTVFYFQFTAFMNIGFYKYPVFVFCLLLFGFIIFANVVMIVVIIREKTLHAPMFIFIACLCFNSLWGSCGLFPRLLMDLLNETHLISRSACFTQIYVIYTYAANDLNILSVMAYDRYVAVCRPLRYHSTMTANAVLKLLVVAAVFPPFIMGTCICLASQLPLCANELHRVFCANWDVVKLSCASTALNNGIGMFLAVGTVFIPFSYVLYTYIRILIVCWRSSSEFKGKVLNNCLPHIISFVVYSATGFSDIALSRSDLKERSPVIAVIFSLEFVVIPPVLNPLVYGLKLPEIRKKILKFLTKAVFPSKIHTGT